MIRHISAFIKKEPMLVAAAAAACASLFLTPPSVSQLKAVDWRTLGVLFMMLTVLEGFKKENVFAPVLRLAGRIRSGAGLALFLVFGVFFSSMFVTNDVSLLIFCPLSILLLRDTPRERYLLPLLAMQNIAAVRGSLLTPFGSPQNLFIFSRSGVAAGRFIAYMFPIWILSAGLLAAFVLFVFRRELRPAETAAPRELPGPAGDKRRGAVWILLFAVVLFTVVSRTPYWPAAAALVLVTVLAVDRRLLLRTDYVLLGTFFCFFIFSSSVAGSPAAAAFLRTLTAGREYAVSILVSQVISNVPAAIVLYPFAENVGALLYGLDSAGLCTLIGSLASVINYRIYVRAYPGRGGRFIAVFTAVSLAFFALVAVPGYLLSRAGF